MIVTNDEPLAIRAKHITTTAKIPHSWDFVHDEVAYNYRLPILMLLSAVRKWSDCPKF